ncbi:putative auxin response factor 3-like isoform X1 [Capsicum annuum]|nr:putative auxin response factor 3-like isoform X1 [Capsicum annuum]
MAGSNSSSAITLETTPTWAVAVVCFILITISILIEHALHLLAKYFNKKRRKYLIQALDNIKTELMLLGFISLLLTVLQKPIAKICIPKGAAETFLPCQSLTTDDDEEEEPKCEQQGKKSLMSRAGVQQLQLLIFALAFFHILSCFLTFSLGTLKPMDLDLLCALHILKCICVPQHLLASFHSSSIDIVTRIVMGVLVHFLCGYVTLPLYALVTQMGTKIKNSVFTDGMISGLRRWQAKAKRKLAKRKNNLLAHNSLDISPSSFDAINSSLSLDISPSFRTLDGTSSN